MLDLDMKVRLADLVHTIALKYTSPRWRAFWEEIRIYFLTH